MVTSFVTEEESQNLLSEDYRHVNADGINVYFAPQTRFIKDTVTFGLEKMFFLSHITVDGIRVLPV